MVTLLAIESSCDETAASIIRNGAPLSNIVASQTELHRQYGGVVPEIASRSHVLQILPVIDEALRQSNTELKQIDAIAVMTTPGLSGSLAIGLTAGKTLAMTLDCPLISVHHLHAHIYANQLTTKENIFPCVGAVVSGGHTSLYNCLSPLDFHLLGSTIDDAAGEAFDKVAQLLNLGFPGGPAIDRASRAGNPKAYRFPRALLHKKHLDFSFSGLKTAVLYSLKGQGSSLDRPFLLNAETVSNIAASFQEAVVDVIASKCKQALQHTHHRILCIGGGVAANRRLREQLTEMADHSGIRLFIPPMSLCTDNAAMAAIAEARLEADLTEDLHLDIVPGLIRP